MESKQIKHIIEAALLAAGRPLHIDELQRLFGESDAPTRQDLRAAVRELEADYAGRGIAVTEVASGYRIQVIPAMAQWLEKLWEERPPRYSRALMETLAIIVYRQPVTRGDIEEIRGVSVTSNIIRTLLERNWIRPVGHRDVPGKPELFGTTREFLDYFGLKKLDELPALGELKDLDKMSVQLGFPETAEDFGEAGDDEASNVSSLDEARAAVAEVAGNDADQTDDSDSDGAETGAANVVPLKSR